MRTWLIAGGALVLTLVGLDLAGWRFNGSGSVPIGFYRETGAAPTVGELAAVCLDRESVPAGQRHRLEPGRCANGTKPLLKCVAATSPKDRLRPTEEGLWYECVPDPLPDPPRPELLELGCHGPELIRRWTLPDEHPPLAPAQTLQTGEMWLYAPSDRSWDSRYFGAQRPLSAFRVESLQANPCAS